MDEATIVRAVVEVRESINIAVVVFLPTLAMLYDRLERPVKGLVGLSFMSVGMGLRSAAIWVTLHWNGWGSDSLVELIIVVVSLLMIATGALCAIRNFTPTHDQNTGKRLWWGGHRLWLTCLVVYVLLLVLNWTVI
jgi:hypothetical protein